MPGTDPQANAPPDATLAHRFRQHGGQRTDLYAYAVRAMAEDWEAGGPIREICAGYENAPRNAVIQLRLLAGIFRLVLTGRADELRPYYPCLGGREPADQAWPVMRRVAAAHVAELHEALRVAPQTNEVGRSVALLVGLYDVLGRTGADAIRLLEVGASAGLNLLLDRYRIEASDGTWAYGPADSPLRLTDAVEGPVTTVPFTTADRRGCDLHPIDPSSAEGRLMLTSFVWPFDLHRHERLRAAFQVVDRVGRAEVDAESAATWLGSQLARPSPTDVLTVVWRSITEQYWPPTEVAAVRAVLDAHGSRRSLAAVSMEFDITLDHYAPPELSTVVWAGDGSPATEQVIGSTHDHGVPVRVSKPT